MTADLEEETHATEHSQGGTDAITIENLASSCTDAQVVGGDGSGGAECQSDQNTTYWAGQGITQNGTVFSLSSSFSGSALEIIGTASGRVVHAQDQLQSSGSLAIEGTATAGDFVCTDCLNFTELSDSLSLDLDTTVSLAGGSLEFDVPGLSPLIIDLDSLGDLFIRESGNVIFTVNDNGSIVMNDAGSSTADVRMEGDTNPNLFFLDASADMIGIGTTTPKTTFEVIGTLSGSTAPTFSALKSCNTIDTDANGALSCGTDATGGGSTSTGALQAIFDTRFVNTSGDTMTGGLAIRSGNGTAALDAGVLLEVLGAMSGRTLHAQDQLRSSGTLVVESGAYIDANTLVVNSQSNRVGVGVTSPKTALEVLGTISGSFLNLQSTSASTKTLVVRAATSQSVNTFEMQDSAGNALTYIDPDGDVRVTRSGNTDDYLDLTVPQSGGLGAPEVDFVESGSRKAVLGYGRVGANPTRVTLSSDTLGAGIHIFDAGGIGIGTNGNSLNSNQIVFNKTEAASTPALAVRGTISGSTLKTLGDAIIGNGAFQVFKFDTSTGALFMNWLSNASYSHRIGYDAPGVIFNSLNNEDVDFRINSLNGVAFFVDASLPGVGIGTTTPEFGFEVDDGLIAAFRGHTFFEKDVTVGAESQFEDGSRSVLRISAVDDASNDGVARLSFADATDDIWYFDYTEATDGFTLSALTGGLLLTMSANRLALSGALVTESGAKIDGNTLVVLAGNNRVGIGTGSPDAALEVIGTASGTALTVSSLKGCDTLDTDANGVLSCGTDSNGGAFTSTGALRTAFDLRYVNVSGDSMTGGLLIQSAAAGVTPSIIDAGLLLEVLGTASGRVIHAQDQLRSSGALTVRKSAVIQSGSLAITRPVGNSTGNLLVVDNKTLVVDGTNKRVGIGTTSPDTTLDVIGTLSGITLNVGGGNSFIRGDVGIGTTAVNVANHRLLTIRSAGTPGIFMYDEGGSADEHYWIMVGNNNDFEIQALNDGISASTTVMRFNRGTGIAVSSIDFPSAANMGIGTSSPKAKLDVLGSLSGSTTFTLSGLKAAGATHSALCRSGTGMIVANTGAPTCTISTLRAKHDIEGLKGSGLDIIAKLRPVSYKDNGTNEENVGFIAEEVEKVDPRLVFYEADGKTVRGFKYEHVTAWLTKGVKEIFAWMLNMDERMIEQDREIDDLKKRIQQLEKRNALPSSSFRF